MKIHRTASAIALASMCAAFLGTVSVAQASPITYDLSNASFYDDFFGITNTLTGSFTFDAATGMESNVNLTASGDDPFFGGTYTDASDGYGGNTGEISALGTSGSALSIYFDNALSNASDPFETVLFGNYSYGPTLVGFSVTGSADPEPVPEPATWAILLAGLLSLAGFAVVRRRKRFGADVTA